MRFKHHPSALGRFMEDRTAAHSYFGDSRTIDAWWALRRWKAPLALDIAAQSDLTAKAGKQMAIADQRHITRRQAVFATNHLRHAALQTQGLWVMIGAFIWAFAGIPVEPLKCGAISC